jgi:hypothetical protein
MMAVARCPQCGEPDGYTKHVKPVGYPFSAVLCGEPNCTHFATYGALIWLKEKEARAYERGQRDFTLPMRAARVRVE